MDPNARKTARSAPARRGRRERVMRKRVQGYGRGSVRICVATGARPMRTALSVGHRGGEPQAAPLSPRLGARLACAVRSRARGCSRKRGGEARGAVPLWGGQHRLQRGGAGRSSARGHASPERVRSSAALSSTSRASACVVMEARAVWSWSTRASASTTGISSGGGIRASVMEAATACQ